MGDCSLVTMTRLGRLYNNIMGMCMLFDFRASGNCVNTRPLICVSHVVLVDEMSSTASE